MPIITKITTQQKNKDRYNIFTDEGKGEKYAFSVDEAVLIKFQLKKGMELDDLFLTEIHYEDDIRKAYNRALHYLTRRMRSEGEVRTYLAEKEIDAPIIQEAILKLYEYKFLNDEQYAIAYVRTQMNTTDKGTIVIKRELKDRGISEELIEKAIQEYPHEAQLETAQKLCLKMVNKNKKDSDLVLKQKLEQMLVRKGYTFEIIADAMAKTELDRRDEVLDALRYQAEKLERKYASLTGYEYEQKMKSALYRKGFTLEQIEKYLSQKDSWENL
jgi:regulatory protein